MGNSTINSRATGNNTIPRARSERGATTTPPAFFLAGIPLKAVGWGIE